MFAGNIFTNGKGNNKFEEKDKLVTELQEHINYALSLGKQPKRKLFSIFCDAKDLATSYECFSTNPEKLARIYQSQFHNVEDNRIFPLGTEKKLVTILNSIIDTEFSAVISNNINTLKNKNSINSNVEKLRELEQKNNNLNIKLKQ